MAKKTQRKGFSFLSFMIGILVGIVLIVGTVVGVGWYALNTDVDKALELVQMNNKDEEGNSIYINTDVESGGAKSIMDLVSKVMNMAEKPDELSVSEVEGLIPAVSGIVDGLYETVNQFVPMDRTELAEVKFAAIADFVQAKVMDIQPAVLFDNLGMEGLTDNKILSLLLLGHEADYVVNGDIKYPVYYDLFDLENDSYKRVGDGTTLDNKFVENLVPAGEQFRLYYYTVDEVQYITDENFTYNAPVARAAIGSVYDAYTPEYSLLSGDYYRNGEERVIINPITVGDFADGSFETLTNVYLSDLLADDNELAEKILGGISLGDVMNNGVDFNSILNGLPLADLIKTKVSDSVMANLVWKIKNIEAAAGEGYTHTGTYTAGDNEYVCYINTEDNGEGVLLISSAYYNDGEKDVEITSITVGDLMNGFGVDDIINDLTISDFMDIKAEEAIMAYLGYEVYGVTAAESGYTAKYDLDAENTVTATIEVDENGVITACYYMDGDNRVNIKSAGINDLSGRITGVTHKLTLGELIGGSDDPIISKLGAYTIDNVSEGINNLTIGDVIENADDNKILSNLKDTPIKELPSKINTLKIGDIMDITDDNTVLKYLANATLETLPTVIANITINDMYASEIYKVTEKDSAGNETVVEEASRKLAVASAPTEGQIIFNPNYLYYVKSVAEDGSESYTLANLEGRELGKLTAEDFAANAIKPAGERVEYYTYGEAQGIWTMLLEKDGSEVAYTLNNMTAMIENVANNMQEAKLNDLHNSGILTFENPERLNQKIKYPIGVKTDDVTGLPIMGADGKPVIDYYESEYTIGEMSLMYFIEFVLSNLAGSSSN